MDSEPTNDPIASELSPSDLPPPPGAAQWNSGDRRSLEDVLPSVHSGMSPETKAAIEAINNGLLHPDCTQLDGYGPKRFSAQVSGENATLKIAFPNNQDYEDWIRELVDNADSVTDWETISEQRMGVLDLPGGERLSVFLPSPSRYFMTFSLRKHNASAWPVQDFVNLGTLDQRMLDFLQVVVAAHVNILFVGAMGAGKTSLLRSLAQSAIADNEKIAVVEQVPELAINKPLANEYIYQPKVPGLTLHEVLDFNLYNGLSRLIVGEVHLEGLTKMLETMILTEGSMSTYHAYSTEQAGERMKMGLQLENNNVTGDTAASFIRQAIELVVVLEKLDGVRRVTQITEIDWRTSAGASQLSGSDLFTFDREKQRFIGTAQPDRQGRIVRKIEKYGLGFNYSWFLEPENITRFQRR
jgi:pilus assembly protein CpaF